MSESDKVTTSTSRDGRVIHILLNRPDKLNALDSDSVDQLQVAIDEIEASETVRVATIRGAGGNFSSGGDLSTLGDAIPNGDREAVDEFLTRAGETNDALDDLSVPLVGIIEGYALAGGLETILACDMVIASDDAKIGDQHANYGLVGGGGTTQRLPRAIGLNNAYELIMTGNRIDAETAADLGLVNWVAPAEDLEDVVDELVDELASKGRETLMVSKHLLERSQDTDLETGLELERELVKQHMFSEDCRKGLEAFHAGEEPEF